MSKNPPAARSLLSVRFALAAMALGAVGLVATLFVAASLAQATARDLSAYHLATLASALRPQLLADMTRPGTKDSFNVTLAALAREQGLHARVRAPDGAVRFSWTPSELPDARGPQPERPPPAVMDSPGIQPEPAESVLVEGESPVLRQTLYARGDCAECHAPVGGRIGTLEMEVPVEHVGGRASRAVYTVALVEAALLILVLGFAVLAVRRVSTRLRGLSSELAQAARGDLSTRVCEKPHDEIGELAAEFNHLLAELEASRRLAAESQKQRSGHMRQLALTGEWAAAAAHEVKNPLGAVTVTLDAMIRKEQDPPRRELLYRIRERLDDIHAVVTGLLEFAKPRNPVPVPMDPTVLLERVLAMLDEKIRKHGAVVRHRPMAGDPRVLADERLMGQVLINLVLNALEAKPEGLELELEVRGDRGLVKILVRDNGPGIEPGDLPRLFQPFYSTKRKGSGLGLVTSRDIVERHGGTLSVESAPGQGTCFTIELSAADDRPQTKSGEARA